MVKEESGVAPTTADCSCQFGSILCLVRAVFV